MDSQVDGEPHLLGDKRDLCVWDGPGSRRLTSFPLQKYCSTSIAEKKRKEKEYTWIEKSPKRKRSTLGGMCYAARSWPVSGEDWLHSYRIKKVVSVADRGARDRIFWIAVAHKLYIRVGRIGLNHGLFGPLGLSRSAKSSGLYRPACP